MIIVSVLFAINPNSPQQSHENIPDKKSRAADEPESEGFEIIKGGTKRTPPSTGDIDIKVIKEQESGQVTTLPWDRDGDFLKAKRENDTPVLMAGYRTVLKDPLPGEEYNVHLGAEMLSGRVVAPGGIFSQNQEIGPYDESKGFREGPTYVGPRLITSIGGGVCKISSTLYNVAVLSNLEIIERYNHSMPVPYVPYGQDATVSYGSRDFRFKNNTSFPLLIWAKGIDNILYIGFYGKEKPPKVEWHHDISNIQKAHTVYIQNVGIPPGLEKMVVEGMDGATVKSRVTITKSDGTIETRDLGISYYRPMPNIIERNTIERSN